MKKTLIFFLLILLACDPAGDDRLMLENNSSSPIMFTMGPYEGDTVESYGFYDCTDSKSSRTYLEPGEKIGYPTSPRGNWETLLPKYPNGTAVFLAFQADSAIKYVKKYGCDGLGKRKELILKRFDVNLDYLNKNNWTVSHP